MAVLLRPRDWIVPRRGMCTAFWCGVILIFTSIVLLVTSRHKGRLYQSWGSVFLGCGCCLLLICLILCIHAYFVMNTTATQYHCQHTTTNNGFHDNDVSPYRHDSIIQVHEIQSLLTTPTPPGGINCDTHCPVDNEPVKSNGTHRQYTDIIDLVSDCHELTSMGHVTRIYRNNCNALLQPEHSKKSSTDHRTMTSLATDKSRYHGDNVNNYDVSTAGKDTYTYNSKPGSHHSHYLQMYNQSHGKEGTLSANHVTSLPRQLRQNDVISPPGTPGSSVTRSFGHAGMITVTPLTARRLKTTDMATVTRATSRPNVHNELLNVRENDGINMMKNDVIESKATVYDNVINI